MGRAGGSQPASHLYGCICLGGCRPRVIFPDHRVYAKLFSYVAVLNMNLSMISLSEEMKLIAEHELSTSAIHRGLMNGGVTPLGLVLV